MVVVGALLSPALLTWHILWLIPLLFVVIRPLSVVVALAGAGVTRREIWLSGWFGVRGVGSVYYLARFSLVLYYAAIVLLQSRRWRWLLWSPWIYGRAC